MKRPTINDCLEWLGNMAPSLERDMVLEILHSDYRLHNKKTSDGIFVVMSEIQWKRYVELLDK